MPKDPTKKPPATAVSESQELENQIRQRAYERYEARGREDSHRPRRLVPRRRGNQREDRTRRRRLTILTRSTQSGPGPPGGHFHREWLRGSFCPTLPKVRVASTNSFLMPAALKTSACTEIASRGA
jgi:hypothetical protein